MADEPTPPREADDEHVALSGTSSIRSMTAGGMTHTSDIPLPLRDQIDPAILVNWDQPLPRRPVFIHRGPGGPPFPPLQTDEPRIGVDLVAEVGRSDAAASDPAHFVFRTLEARVAILEAALASRPAHMGHNRGPSLDERLDVNEAEIQHLVALLKEQRPTAPVDLAKLTEAAKAADPNVNKWRERLDTVVKGALFGAGKKAGEELVGQLAQASWFQSVYSALQGVFEALITWMNLF